MTRLCRTVHGLIRGGLSNSGLETMGVGLSPSPKGLEWPPNPTVFVGRYGSWTEVHLERDGVTVEPYGDSDSASGGNVWCDWTEVSRGHSSQMLIVMGEMG